MVSSCTSSTLLQVASVWAGFNVQKPVHNKEIKMISGFQPSIRPGKEPVIEGSMQISERARCPLCHQKPHIDDKGLVPHYFASILLWLGVSLASVVLALHMINCIVGTSEMEDAVKHRRKRTLKKHRKRRGRKTIPNPNQLRDLEALAGATRQKSARALQSLPWTKSRPKRRHLFERRTRVNRTFGGAPAARSVIKTSVLASQASVKPWRRITEAASTVEESNLPVSKSRTTLNTMVASSLKPSTLSPYKRLSVYHQTVHKWKHAYHDVEHEAAIEAEALNRKKSTFI
ncbi:hypothetical protein PoB_001188100 [Plakobranchus ocellatus]|uniref:Uncharacterized protein n=1 Tax=Plakobranchus ocellatus TaxID=259542 RepID=A0AAV3YSJ5_9GAST|nr:hypothetical protein PoB_001188100 [Plakobranchus ocellatus]